MIYLDYAAATPVHPEVFQAMEPWFKDKFGNPSSLHQLGQEARAAVDHARMTIADWLDCQPTEVFFTSSGTESCNWALLGICEQKLLRGEQAHIIVSQIEHSAVLETARFLEKAYGVQVTFVPVDEQGKVSVEQISNTIQDNTVLVSVMTVNNEIGSIQPIAELGKLCRERGVYLHTDACQATAWMELNVEELQVDLMTINASKISGPKGSAILYVREGTVLSNWTFGGGQEFKMRAGTENVPAIVGFGRAIELLKDAHLKAESLQVAELKKTLWLGLSQQLSDLQLNGSLETSAPHILNLHVPGIEGETLVRKMDLQGFAISSGSACASGTIEPSHVVMALGQTEEVARSSIRISLGKHTTEKEVESFQQALLKAVQELRS